MNLFCERMKAVVEEELSKAADKLWAFTLLLDVSPLRGLAAVGTAPAKKVAKGLAAAMLLTVLLAAVLT